MDHVRRSGVAREVSARCRCGRPNSSRSGWTPSASGRCRRNADTAARDHFARPDSPRSRGGPARRSTARAGRQRHTSRPSNPPDSQRRPPDEAQREPERPAGFRCGPPAPAQPHRVAMVRLPSAWRRPAAAATARPGHPGRHEGHRPGGAHAPARDATRSPDRASRTRQDRTIVGASGRGGACPQWVCLSTRRLGTTSPSPGANPRVERRGARSVASYEAWRARGVAADGSEFRCRHDRALGLCARAGLVSVARGLAEHRLAVTAREHRSPGRDRPR